MSDVVKRISETENGLTKEVEIRQAENGYVVSITKYGQDPKDSDKWIDERKTYISSNNPLDKKESSDIPEMTREEMIGYLKSI